MKLNLVASNLIYYAKFTALQLFEQQLADHPLLIVLGTLQFQPVQNGLYIVPSKVVHYLIFLGTPAHPGT